MIRKNSKLCRLLRNIAKDYKVSVRFTIRESNADPEKDIIYVERDLDSEVRFISYFFHELAHIINFRRGKYLKYHKSSSRLTMDVLRACVYTGLKAEKYTDKIAESLMKKHFKCKYLKVYNADIIDWYKTEWWNTCYSEVYKKRCKRM